MCGEKKTEKQKSENKNRTYQDRSRKREGFTERKMET